MFVRTEFKGKCVGPQLCSHAIRQFWMEIPNFLKSTCTVKTVVSVD